MCSSGETAVRFKSNTSVVPRQVARVACSCDLESSVNSDYMALPLLFYMHCRNSLKND
jgi:hypothetical protein